MLGGRHACPDRAPIPPRPKRPGRRRRRATPAGDRPTHRQLRRPNAAGRDRTAVTRQPSSPTRHERMTTMQRTAAAAGSAVFFALAPGTIVGLVPWLITDWHPGAPLSHLLPLRVLGAVLVVAGTAILVSAFARFVVEGLGTPAPVAPPAHLVIGGLYRYVRNPIYLALDVAILGQAILLWRPGLLWYTGFVALALAAWVHGLEQPELESRFGAQYDEYRRAVPGWWPRRRPWQPR